MNFYNPLPFGWLLVVGLSGIGYHGFLVSYTCPFDLAYYIVNSDSPNLENCGWYKSS